MIKNVLQKYILSFLIIISCYIISCNAEPNLENMKKEIKIISGVLFVSLLISFIIMWLNKNRKNLLKGKIVSIIFSYVKLYFSNNMHFFFPSCVKIYKFIVEKCMI